MPSRGQPKEMCECADLLWALTQHKAVQRTEYQKHAHSCSVVLWMQPICCTAGDCPKFGVNMSGQKTSLSSLKNNRASFSDLGCKLSAVLWSEPLPSPSSKGIIEYLSAFLDQYLKHSNSIQACLGCSDNKAATKPKMWENNISDQ